MSSHNRLVRIRELEHFLILSKSKDDRVHRQATLIVTPFKER
jgi:hypothetical protein